MRLDMYLYLVKKTYNSTFKEKEYLYPEELKGFEDNIKERNFSSVVATETKFQIGYWRKANAIHNWFVQKCADGVDECQTIYVGKAQLNELLITCEEVINNPGRANELLPTSSGFFFGSTDYDKWYFEDLKYTVDLIKKIFDFAEQDLDDNADYYVIYNASW